MWTQPQVKRTLTTPEGLAQIRARLETGRITQRGQLADALCADFEFRNARGQPQRSSCLAALRALEAAGLVELPPPRPGRPPNVPEVPPPIHLEARELAAVVGLELVPVEDEATRQAWRQLLHHEHPRGAGPFFGPQLRYLIRCEAGWIGAIGFAAAAGKVSARDGWIGWDDETRRRHLHRVVNLSRLLIRPGVQCRNLVSHILSRVLRDLPGRFEARYGFRPWLMETFVDTLTHDGVSLKASNWLRLGCTAGRGRLDAKHVSAETPKHIFVYPLARNWRRHLALPPAPERPDAPMAAGAGLDDDGWAEQEFGGAPLGDKRLERRLVMSAGLQAADPTQAFTRVAKEDWPAVKGYYRLIDKPAESEVTSKNILAPHRERTIQRMRAQQTVLCVQDGTDLNFTSRPMIEGLGLLGRNQTGASSHGLHVHSTLAVSDSGLPLGLLNTRFEAPTAKTSAGRGEPGERKSRYWVDGLEDCRAVAAELPRTRLVSVMDREADFFSLYTAQREKPAVEVLVRAKSDRNLLEWDADSATFVRAGKLFETLRNQHPGGHMELSVARASVRPKLSGRPAHPGRKARTARMALSWRQVTFGSTLKEHVDEDPVTVWVVHAREQSPPEGATRLEWCLLTTVAVEDAGQAEEVLRWYCLRWRIEDWHRVLKTGCRVDELGHNSADRLSRAISIRMVIAWRIMLMTLLGRESPELPPDLLFTDIELKVLRRYALKRKNKEIHTLKEAVTWTAILGGYQNRKHDPPPGADLTWYGRMKLAAMCEVLELYDLDG